jgi:hypothetical protein
VNAPDHHSPVPDAKPEPNQVVALDRASPRKEIGVGRPRVRFIGYRARPLDADNFAGSCKDLLDGLVAAGLLESDAPGKVEVFWDQVKVARLSEEKTVIEITTCEP